MDPPPLNHMREIVGLMNILLHSGNISFFVASALAVVCFDQGLGAAHSKRWSKYAFLMFLMFFCVIK